jgi:hypothetical protein
MLTILILFIMLYRCHYYLISLREFIIIVSAVGSDHMRKFDLNHFW